MDSSLLSDDNERLDCGHYEYMDRAIPTPGGFLICTDCHARLLASPPVQTSAARTQSRLAWLSCWLTRRRLPHIPS